MIAALAGGLLMAAAFLREDRLRMERERMERWTLMDTLNRWQMLNRERHALLDKMAYQARLIQLAVQRGEIDQLTADEGLKLLRADHDEQKRDIQRKLDSLNEDKS